MAEAFVCSCDSTPPTDPPAAAYRRARSKVTGRLANVYLPVDAIPAGPADFEFYNPDDGFCYRIAYSDPIVLTPGFVPDGWEPFETTAEHDRLCTDAPDPTYYQALRCGTSKAVNLWVATAVAASLPFTFKDMGVCYTIPVASATSTLPFDAPQVDPPTPNGGCADGECDDCHPDNFDDNHLVPLAVGDVVSLSACQLADYLGVADDAVPEGGTIIIGTRQFSYARGAVGTGATACPCPNGTNYAYTVTRLPDTTATLYRQARRCSDHATTGNFFRLATDPIPYRFSSGGVSYIIDSTSPLTDTPGFILDGTETPGTDCHHAAGGDCAGTAFEAGFVAAIAPGATAYTSSCRLAAYLGVSTGALPTSGFFNVGSATYNYARTATSSTAGTVCPCEDGGGWLYSVTNAAGGPVYRRATRCSPTIRSEVDVTAAMANAPGTLTYFFGGQQPDLIANGYPDNPQLLNVRLSGGAVKWDAADLYWSASKNAGQRVYGYGTSYGAFPVSDGSRYTSDILDPNFLQFQTGAFPGGLYGPVTLTVANTSPGAATTTTALPRVILEPFGITGDVREQIAADLWVQDGTFPLPAYINVGGVGYTLDAGSPTSGSPGANLLTAGTATLCTSCADSAVAGCTARTLGTRLGALPVGWKVEVASCWLEAFVYWLGLTGHVGSSPTLPSEGTFLYAGRTFLYRQTTTGTAGMECPCPDGGGSKYLVWPGGHFTKARRCSDSSLTSLVVNNTYLNAYFTAGGVGYYAQASDAVPSQPGGTTLVTDAAGHFLTGYTEASSC